MCDIKVSLSCKAFAVTIINVDIKSVGMIKVSEVFHNLQNGDMKQLRGFAFNLKDLEDCFNDEIFRNMLTRLFYGVFSYSKTRLEVDKVRITVWDSISCSLEHDEIIKRVASYVGLSDESPNEELMKAFMTFLEAEYANQVMSMNEKAVLKRKKEAEVLRNENWSDKSRSGVDYNITPAASRFIMNQRKINNNSVESNNSSNDNNDSQTSSLTGNSSSNTSSTKLSVESLSDLIKNLNNKEYNQLLDNVAVEDRFVESVKKKKIIDNDNRSSDRLSRIIEVDYNQSNYKDLTNKKLRDQIAVMQDQYKQLVAKFVVADRTMDSLKKQVRRLEGRSEEAVVQNKKDVEENFAEIATQTELLEDIQVDVANDIDILSFEERLSELIEERGKLYTLVKGQKALSMHSGMFLQNLVSSCLVSVNKIPEVIGSVLTLMFGDLGDWFLNSFINNAKTYDDAMIRSSEVLNSFNSDLFIEKDTNEFSQYAVPIIFACLIVDGANKKGMNLNTKPFTYLGLDWKIHQSSLHTDHTHSKKQSITSASTFDSIVEQIGIDGVTRINGAGCDKFAEGELSKVLNAIDELSNRLWENENERHKLRYQGLYGVIYIYGVGGFRKHRVWTCLMHALENILKPLLESILSTRGISKDATVLSNIFKVHWFNKRYKDLFDFLNVQSVGGEVERLKELPKVIQRTFKEVADTRWLSQERQCNELIDFINVPATEDLINFVKADFVYSESSFEKVLKQCCTWDDESVPSQYILQILYIANHSAGGKTGDAAQYGRDLVAFLTNPFTRICVESIAKIYPMHCSIAKFANGRSLLRYDVSTISTRLLEAPIYYRRIHKYFYDITRDWKNLSINLPDFIDSEIFRARFHQLPHVDSMMNDMEQRFASSLPTVWDLSVKYMQQPFLNAAFSIVLILVKELSAHFAAGLLEGLEASEYIEITQNEREMFIDSSLQIDDVEVLNNHIWSNMNDPYFAYPNMTYLQFRELIRDSFTLDTRQRETKGSQEKNRTIEGLVNGYGLMCNEIINELISIACGEHLHNDWWKSGDAIKNYFEKFIESYPNIAECLIINFIYMSITSTISEQQFTVATNIQDANLTESTSQRHLNFYYTIRAKIIRELLENSDEDTDTETELEVNENITKKKNKKHKLNNKRRLNCFLHQISIMTDEMQQQFEVKVLKRGLGKKKEQIKNSLPNLTTEMELNFRGHSRLFKDSDISNYMVSFSNAYHDNVDILTRPVEEESPIEKVVNHSFWKADTRRLFLNKKDVNFTIDIENSAKCVRRPRIDPPYPLYKTVQDYQKEYFETISEQDLLEILQLLDNKILTIEYMKTNYK